MSPSGDHNSGEAYAAERLRLEKQNPEEVARLERMTGVVFGMPDDFYGPRDARASVNQYVPDPGQPQRITFGIYMGGSTWAMASFSPEQALRFSNLVRSKPAVAALIPAETPSAPEKFVNPAEDEDARYDRLVYDAAAEIAQSVGRNCSLARTWLRCLDATSEEGSAVLSEQVSPEYEAVEMRGKLCDEGVYEAFKEILRRVHRFGIHAK